MYYPATVRSAGRPTARSDVLRTGVPEINGRTLRRSLDWVAGPSALHVGRPLEPRTRQAIGQRAVAVDMDRQTLRDWISVSTLTASLCSMIVRDLDDALASGDGDHAVLKARIPRGPDFEMDSVLAWRAFDVCRVF